MVTADKKKNEKLKYDINRGMANINIFICQNG